MEPTNDVVQLLREIRDTQREHLAEYKWLGEEALALNKKADERYTEQYRNATEQNRALVKVWNALWWAITALIAISLGSLLIILQQVSAARPR